MWWPFWRVYQQGSSSGPRGAASLEDQPIKYFVVFMIILMAMAFVLLGVRVIKPAATRILKMLFIKEL